MDFGGRAFGGRAFAGCLAGTAFTGLRAGDEGAGGAFDGAGLVPVGVLPPPAGAVGLVTAPGEVARDGHVVPLGAAAGVPDGEPGPVRGDAAGVALVPVATDCWRISSLAGAWASAAGPVETSPAAGTGGATTGGGATAGAGSGTSGFVAVTSASESCRSRPGIRTESGALRTAGAADGTRTSTEGATGDDNTPAGRACACLASRDLPSAAASPPPSTATTASVAAPTTSAPPADDAGTDTAVATWWDPSGRIAAALFRSAVRARKISCRTPEPEWPSCAEISS